MICDYSGVAVTEGNRERAYLIVECVPYVIAAVAKVAMTQAVASAKKNVFLLDFSLYYIHKRAVLLLY